MNTKDAADLAFMALVIWREARGESDEGKIGVAHAILNRVARPSWWGKSITEVLFKKWQFSSMTDPRDPQLVNWPLPGDKSWISCLAVAETALAEFKKQASFKSIVPGADSYYDISLDKIGKPPAWIKTARFVRQIGRVKFYDVDHDYQAI